MKITDEGVRKVLASVEEYEDGPGMAYNPYRFLEWTEQVEKAYRFYAYSAICEAFHINRWGDGSEWMDRIKVYLAPSGRVCFVLEDGK